MTQDAKKKHNLPLEMENRELATRQVRRINDTLRKVRSLSKDSMRAVREAPAVADSLPVINPIPRAPVQEVYGPRTKKDKRREDSTDQFLLPEPSSETTLSDLFTSAMGLLETECAGMNIALPGFAGSPVVRRWKIV